MSHRLARTSRKPLTTRPARTRKALSAALRRAKVQAEEDYRILRLRMFEAAGASGELHGLATMSVQEAEEQAEQSASRVVEIENQIVDLQEARRADRASARRGARSGAALAA